MDLIQKIKNHIGLISSVVNIIPSVVTLILIIKNSSPRVIVFSFFFSIGCILLTIYLYLFYNSIPKEIGTGKSDIEQKKAPIVVIILFIILICSCLFGILVFTNDIQCSEFIHPHSPNNQLGIFGQIVYPKDNTQFSNTLIDAKGFFGGESYDPKYLWIFTSSILFPYNYYPHENVTFINDHEWSGTGYISKQTSGYIHLVYLNEEKMIEAKKILYYYKNYDPEWNIMPHLQSMKLSPSQILDTVPVSIK